MSGDGSVIASSPLTRTLFASACFIIIVAGLKAGAAMVVPFLLSLTVAMIFAPLLQWFTRHRVPMALSVVLVVLLIVTIGLVIGGVAGSSANQFIADLPTYQERLRTLVDGLAAPLANYGIDIQHQLREQFDPAILFTFAGTALSSLGNLMTNAFLILLTTLFILGEAAVFSDKLHLALGERNRVLPAFAKIGESINRYIALKALISLGTGVTIMLLLTLIGVDYPVLWGLLAFLLNFVPNIGSIIAAVPAVLLAVVQLGYVEAALTAASYFGVNTLFGNLIEPKVMGRRLDLSTLVVWISLVFWGWILGPVGMLLSVPLTMVVKIALESVEETRWIAILLGSGRSAPLDFPSAPLSQEKIMLPKSDA